MTDKPAVLIVHRHLDALTAVLDSAYTVYRLWEGPPVEASHAIRALVMAGELPLEAHLLDSLPALGLIAVFNVGYDGVDIADARRRGLQLSHAPGANHEDVADHALGLILASRRQIVEGDHAVRTGAWTAARRTITRSLNGAKVGIVGLGRIGQALAIRCESFGMSIAWWGPRPKPDQPWPRAESLLALARDSDILVVCASLDEGSRRIVDRPILDALGAHGLLVNVARGGSVDEAAVIAALKDGRLGAAALDVFDEEPTPHALWAQTPNVILTPHTGGATDRAVAQMVALLMQNLGAFFAGQPLKTPIEG
jgi:lactate dehydrogenase-like 2-hydroxyacid dehydrogenase